jgi:hypothetical protein
MAPNSREEPHPKSRQDPPKHHDLETRRERLEEAPDAKDESAGKQRHASAKDVSHATSEKGGYCDGVDRKIAVGSAACVLSPATSSSRVLSRRVGGE